MDRHAGLKGYCTGLMLPLSRKSVEPMAARVDPLHASARHQSLHHFVAKAEWFDDEMLRRISQWVVPKMDMSGGGFWIIDDTGFPKKGKHSVGVARQYCGVLGKQDNCQVSVSISLATEQASVPVAYRLYLPKEWAQDPERRQKAGVPADIGFATKNGIALQPLETLLAEGAPKYCVLADAGYGFLVAERIAAGKSAGAKKTSPSAKFLRFPRITSLAAAQRAQRHVSDSITTIRYQLSFQLIGRLGQCSCCGRQNVSQLL